MLLISKKNNNINNNNTVIPIKIKNLRCALLGETKIKIRSLAICMHK